MNFVLHNDYKAHVFSVLNRSPHPGEPRHWDSVWDDLEHRAYGLVAFTPNLSGNGNALLVEGKSMAGTEVAWDFVSHDSELLPFLKRIQRVDGSIPHFELLLGTENMSASAVHSNLLAWRRVIDPEVPLKRPLNMVADLIHGPRLVLLSNVSTPQSPQPHLRNSGNLRAIICRYPSLNRHRADNGVPL